VGVMLTVREVMIKHLKWLKKERVRVAGEIEMLTYGLKDIDETIKNWEELLNARNPESGR
jgi:hypothetical protein